MPSKPKQVRPSTRKQINIRATDETLSRLARLAEMLPGVLGMQQVSQADVISMALIELERKYSAAKAPAGREKR